MKINKKYILYIVLGIIALSLLILLILYITNPLRNVYDRKWYIFKYEVYNGDELLSSVDIYNDSYILFDNDKIEYCLNFGESCEKLDYDADKKTITSYVDNIFAKGEYRYEIDDDGNFKLSKEIDGRTVVYWFAMPVG